MIPGQVAAPPRRPALVAVLDVGHGNCTVIVDGAGCTVIDTARGSLLERALKEIGVTAVDHVLVSHGDADHCSGLVPFLLEGSIRVGTIFLNPDPRGRAVWDALARAIAVAEKRDGTRLVTQLSTGTVLPGVHTEYRIEVLWPRPLLMMHGVGSAQMGGAASPNRLSAAVRVWRGATAVALLAGDIDATALAGLQASGVDLSAATLVFPHHGGQPGRNQSARAFARDLVLAVRPRTVVFSVERREQQRAQQFPLSDVVAGVREAAPGCHIACTELVKACSGQVPTRPPTHLGVLPTRARGERCCAGTVRLDAPDGLSEPSIAVHATFVQQFAGRLCL